jgi:hypothetical protein
MSDAELQRELSALPDVGAKATTLGQSADERESAASRGAEESGTGQ